MKNLIVSLLLAIAAFGLGWWATSTWIAGIPTGLIALIAGVFFLGRRSMKKLTDLSQQVAAELQAGQQSQNPELMLKGIDAALQKLENGMSLASEQFLVKPMLQSQMGALAYQGAGLQLQMKLQSDAMRQTAQSIRRETAAKKYFQRAYKHLAIAHARDWSLQILRSWQGMGMLAAMDHKEGNTKQALERLSKCKGIASDDPLFWGTYAWMLMQDDQASEALLVISSGLDKNKDHQVLKQMSDAIANKKPVDVSAFGMMWYSIFPDQLDMKAMMRLQQEQTVAAGQAESFSDTKLNRKQRRILDKQQRRS